MKKDYYGISILTLLIALPIISIGLSVYHAFKKDKKVQVKVPEKSDFFEPEPEIEEKTTKIEPEKPIIKTVEAEK